VDAGAEFGYMAADITRTYPSSGHFTVLQRRAYEIVLRAQECAISAVKPGATLEEVHQTALLELISGLRDLEILSGSDDEILKAESYKKYYMHRTSHWLGMDVHDVGAYFIDGKPRPLMSGMVLTVEPGLYFAADDPAIPVGLRDVGIRIEDDILVTPTGCENLSQSIFKTVEAIELAMSRSA
ncbi:MAG TPA: M24 family metallopeptidase, partial [Polyangiaceae bacterium]